LHLYKREEIPTVKWPNVAEIPHQKDADLWYRVHVLLHDLSNVALDSNAEKRISTTTHELYISSPHFTESESIMIRTALLDDIADAEATKVEGASNLDDSSSPAQSEVTIKEAIHSRLSDFFDKRKAGGDARPCGPHDMVPIYGSVFGIRIEELKDERFLSRLRKSGLGDSQCRGESMSEGKAAANDDGKKRKKGTGGF
jgi:hypothetical protein